MVPARLSTVDALAARAGRVLRPKDNLYTVETPAWTSAHGLHWVLLRASMDLVGAVDTMAASESAALRSWGILMLKRLKKLLFDEDGFQGGGQKSIVYEGKDWM